MNQIAEYISNNHKGHKNACPSSTLEQVFSINERALRDLIVESIEKDHALIGSSERGYFLIETPQDYSVARQHLTAPFEKLRKRITSLEFNYKISLMNELPLGV